MEIQKQFGNINIYTAKAIMHGLRTGLVLNAEHTAWLRKRSSAPYAYELRWISPPAVIAKHEASGEWHIRVNLHETFSDNLDTVALEDIENYEELLNKLSGEWVELLNENECFTFSFVFGQKDKSLLDVLRDLKMSGIDTKLIEIGSDQLAQPLDLESKNLAQYGFANV